MLVLAPDMSPETRAVLGYRNEREALFDPRGRGLRTTPCRRTLLHDLPGGTRVFRKHRRGRRGDARREWRAMGELAALGITAPRPLFFASRGRHSVLGMAAVPGRAMDVLLSQAKPQAIAAVRELAPALCRQLHRSGWVFRDLYWNHVFFDGEALALVDVERAFQPMFRMRRWVVKDLAGLVSSLPLQAGLGLRDLCLGLRRYDPSLDRGARLRLARELLHKAARIRGHRTRYPG